MVALADAIDDYLAYLRVERGLAPRTIRAYRADLTDFAASRGAARGWDRSPEVALDYLAARTRRGRPHDPGLAPNSLRRRAAALKGFYRFCFGEGLIGSDVAAHLDLPRQPRLLPETLTVEEVTRLLDAAGGDDPDEPDHERRMEDRTLLELLYAAGLRIGEATGLDREDLSFDGAFVRVIGKGDRERLVPLGEVALDWLRRWTAGPRERLLSLGHVAPSRGGPLFLGPSRRAPRTAAGVGIGEARGGPSGAGLAGQPAHAAPLVRDPSARGRGRPAHRSGIARTCEYQHDPALHPRDG